MTGRAFFIRTLAEVFTENQAEMSIKLQLGAADAKLWARLRNAGPGMGWATTDEAEALLTTFLQEPAHREHADGRPFVTGPDPRD